MLREELNELDAPKLAAEESSNVITSSDHPIAVLTDSGELLATRFETPSLSEILPAGTPDEGVRTVETVYGAWRVQVRRERFDQAAMVLVVASPLNAVARDQAEMREAFLLGMPIALALAAAGGLWLASIGLRPITVMARRASELPLTGTEDLAPSIRNDELGQLTRAFNALVARLRSALQTQRQFMADASHELRNPVSVIRNASEVALGREHRDECEYREALAITSAQSHRLSALVEDMTLRQLLTYAYELQTYEIFGGPDWATNDRFDITATMQLPPTGSDTRDGPARNRHLLRALLAERFNLVVHEERREMPVYSLTMARRDRQLGARLRAFEGECGEPGKIGSPPDATFGMPTLDPSKGPQWCMAFTRVGRISAQGTTLSDLGMTLARLPAVSRRVLDRTGLSGRFDFDLEWAPLVTPSGPAAPGVPPDAGPTIFTALQEQLGLRLEPANETIPVLVIDSVNKPSPN